MGARVVMIVGITLGLLAQWSAPGTARSDHQVTIRLLVDGRLLGQKATLQIYDRDGKRTISVGRTQTVRVHAGNTTIVPKPIRDERPSTATIQQFTAENDTVVRIHYRRDTTSRPGPMVPLARGSDGEPAVGSNWVQSPDKSRLAFTSSDASQLPQGEDRALFVRDLTTGDVAKAADGAVEGLSWSPDSRRIAYGSDIGRTPGGGKLDVHVKDLADGDVTVASVRSDGTRFAAARAIAWQDDDHLVLSGCDTARQYRNQECGIQLRSLSLGETRQIVPAGYRISNSQLAPDGRGLLFESAGDPLDLGIERRAIYLTDLATAVTSVLSMNKKGQPANGAAWGAVWSPDARKVAFRSTADNLVARDTNGRKDPRRGTDVFIADLGSRKVTRVSTTSAGKQMPGDRPRNEPAVQWSPNGKVVAFRFATSPTASRRSANSAVFVKRLSSGKLEPLIPRKFSLPHAPVVTGYVFSPSGDRIAFVFGSRKGCWTDLVPFANLNCDNVLVRDLGSDRLSNVSTLDNGLGWQGGPQDRLKAGWSPVWLSEDQLVFLAANRTPRSRMGPAVPVIKTVKWAPGPGTFTSPAPWEPAWCSPYKWWWSC